MHRLLIGLASLLLVVVWGGTALVHAGRSTDPDFVVEGTIIDPDDTSSLGIFTLTNNTTDFFVKAFAISLGENIFAFLNAGTAVPGWTAQATDDAPIYGLPGAGGGVGTPKEYVFYTACDANGVNCAPFLGQGTAACFDSLGQRTACFTFNLFQMSSFLPSFLGIVAVDRTGQEVTCLSERGEDGCSLSRVPEPSTWLLLATGLVGLLGYGWRRRHAGSAMSRGQACRWS